MCTLCVFWLSACSVLSDVTEAICSLEERSSEMSVLDHIMETNPDTKKKTHSEGICPQVLKHRRCTVEIKQRNINYSVITVMEGSEEKELP